MPGEKRVGKFLCRPDVPPALRRKVCIIEDEEGIVWVAPVRLDRRGRVTAQTDRVLEIRVTPSTGVEPPRFSRQTLDKNGFL
jgi:hypothetical protein